jgi:putative ATP-binding cassette transporter
MEERLGLLWREFLTRRAVNIYLDEGTYYRLQAAEGLANPDQRIAEDVRAFTVTTLSFVLMLLNSAFTVIAFSGVLWSISPLLFGLAGIYAACGSYVTLILSRPLIKLNYDQLDKEADFRSELIRVRENAELILLAHREDRLRARLLRRLENFVANFRKITSANRKVGFFTTGYNWLIQIIPALIVAPSFIAGQIEFGVITQSAMAFTLIVNASSLIVTQVQSLSNSAAVIARLNSLIEGLERKQPAAAAGIETSEEDRCVAYEELTLLSPLDSQPVLKDLSISIPFGSRVLISGSSETGRLALFRATAGLWNSGKGRILRPAQPAYPFWPSGRIYPRALCAKFSFPRSLSVRSRMGGLKTCCRNWNANQSWSARAGLISSKIGKRCFRWGAAAPCLYPYSVGVTPLCIR